VRARVLSHATMGNIRQNLFLAFIYNVIGIPIAAGALYPAFGLLLSPMLGRHRNEPELGFRHRQCAATSIRSPVIRARWPASSSSHVCSLSIPGRGSAKYSQRIADAISSAFGCHRRFLCNAPRLLVNYSLLSLGLAKQAEFALRPQPVHYVNQ
jgi:hypothetical protein